MTNPATDALREAADLVSNDRREAYGDPRDHFQDVATVWSVRLREKLTHDLTPTEVAELLALLKICRNVSTAKRDNFVDGAGYLALAWEVGSPPGPPEGPPADVPSPA